MRCGSMSRRLILSAAVISAAIAIAAGQSDQQLAGSRGAVQARNTPAPYTRPSSGKEMYVAYCASCHGKDGRGDGPAAASLKSAPSDLTQLSARNGGKFPENHVTQTIRGDAATSSHGSKDMPVWGPIFVSMETRADGVAQLRIRNLTRYIASLQQK